MSHDAFTVVCPYYYKTIGNHLFCQGPCGTNQIGGTLSYVKQCFATRSDRNTFMHQYCACFGYHHCQIAKVNRLYTPLPLE